MKEESQQHYFSESVAPIDFKMAGRFPLLDLLMLFIHLSASRWDGVMAGQGYGQGYDIEENRNIKITGSLIRDKYVILSQV